MKKLANFTIEAELILKLKEIAKKQNRSFSNLMETIAIDFLAKQEGGKEGEK